MPTFKSLPPKPETKISPEIREAVSAYFSEKARLSGTETDIPTPKSIFHFFSEPGKYNIGTGDEVIIPVFSRS